MNTERPRLRYGAPVIAKCAHRVARFCSALTDAQRIGAIASGPITDLSGPEYHGAAAVVHAATSDREFLDRLGRVFGPVSIEMRACTDRVPADDRPAWTAVAGYFRHGADVYAPRWPERPMTPQELTAFDRLPPLPVRFDLLAELVHPDAVERLGAQARAVIRVATVGDLAH